MSYYCEMCGRELDAKEAKKAIVEGSLLILCSSCYQRLSKQSIVKEPQPRREIKIRERIQVEKPARTRIEEYEVVEDYASRVRTAREKLGWSQEVLAMKIGEGVNTIKRIETGKLRPSIPIARKLEKTLGIKLLEPVVDEVEKTSRTSSKVDYATLGDFIKIDDNNRSKNN
ncbi:MAG: multiprotein bridging factor aMBF1 [Desulfurococcaceae archaeon]